MILEPQRRASAVKTKTRSIDGVRPTGSSSPPGAKSLMIPAAKPVPRTRKRSLAKATKPLAQPAIRRRRSQVYVRNWLELAIIVGALIGVVVILRSAIATQLAIAVYALIVWFRRIDSQTTFTLAVTSLGAVVGLLLIKPDSGLAAGFAEYSFLLFIIGTVSLIMETRRNVA